MRANQYDLASSRQWGGLAVAGTNSFPEHGPQRCDAPHWGYIIRGVIRISYPDHEELISGGDAYYVAPGHFAIELGDAELIDFSPSPTAVR